ncbi:MAG: hypothetical protein JW797_09260 [Bradymonadales bacterium]|nr:hypothetical protein [Bradymonadales bacterium]
MKAITPWILFFGLAASGCTNEAINPRTCGEGTVEVEGVCQSLLQCGAATTRVGDECQFTPSVQCGSGTVLVDETCVRETEPRSCGEDTVEVEGECLREVPLVVCGEGTIEVEEECVVADPLACGTGTTLVGTVCTHQPCGEGTVLADDLVTCEAVEFTSQAGLIGLCPRAARALCEGFDRCGCPIPEELPEITQLVYTTPDLCEEVLKDQCRTIMVWIAALDATGQTRTDNSSVDAMVDMYTADASCNMEVADILGGPHGTDWLNALLEPALDSGERCNYASTIPICLEEEEVCRLDVEASTEEENIYTCQQQLGLYEVCGRTADCLPALYCDPDAMEDPTCQTRPTLDEPCHPTNEPCTTGYCCIANLCAALPDEGETCCGDNTCGDPAVLYCNTSYHLCAAYAQEGDICEDGVKCGVGMMCHLADPEDDARTCVSTMPFCDYYSL